MKVRFPKRRPDGSFCVQVSLNCAATNRSELAERINSWSREWVERNQYWKTPSSEVSDDYFAQFVNPPPCVVDEHGQLQFRIVGRSDAHKWWRDWLVRKILPALCEKFKDVIDIDRISNCPDDL